MLNTGHGHSRLGTLERGGIESIQNESPRQNAAGLTTSPSSTTEDDTSFELLDLYFSILFAKGLARMIYRIDDRRYDSASLTVHRR